MAADELFANRRASSPLSKRLPCTDVAMPFLDASVITQDMELLEFLRDILGPAERVPDFGSGFQVDRPGVAVCGPASRWNSTCNELSLNEAFA